MPAWWRKRARALGRCLKKAEKQAVATAINKVGKSELLLEHVDKELHIHSFQDRLMLWERLKVSGMVTVCECLKELYESTYSKCLTGKEKHARFQLEWYQQCGYVITGAGWNPKCIHIWFAITNTWARWSILQVWWSSHCRYAMKKVSSCPVNDRGTIVVEISEVKAMVPTKALFLTPVLRQWFYALPWSSSNPFHQGSGWQSQGGCQQEGNVGAWRKYSSSDNW